MSEKNNRKTTVCDIIRSRKIHTQEELMQALEEKGIRVTQATLSRDIKEIGAIKTPDPEEGTFYSLPHSNNRRHVQIDGLEISGQLCVLHAQPGFAPAIASVIDEEHIPGVMGTIAGDDTVLMMLREDAGRNEVADRVRSLFLIRENEQ